MAYTQIQKVINSAGSANDNFGNAVAMSEYYMAITEPNNVTTYVYKRGSDNNWSYHFTMIAVGNSVAIGNKYTVAGRTPFARLHEISTGRFVRLFIKGLVAGFGNAIAISDDYVVIGAPDFNSARGAIYIYEKSGLSETWAEYPNPVIPDTQSNDDYFGCCVGIYNNSSIIVGAKGDNNNTGAIYVFDKDEDGIWRQTQKILASDGESGDEFGYSLSVSGEYFVTGARSKDSDTDEVNAGAAYIHKYSTAWYEVDKLEGTGEDSYEGNNFGESVHINGDYIIVGSPQARSLGVADIFYKKRSWGHVKKIMGSDSTGGDDFGKAVAIAGRFAVVGSPDNDEVTTNAGAAYIFENPPVKLRLAQEFDVNGEYLPSKATVYLKKVGKNIADNWQIYGTSSTVIDATNFSTIIPTNNVIRFSDTVSGYTGNGYMVLEDTTFPTFGVINYPVRAIEADTFDLWIRCLSSSSDRFIADVMIDGKVIQSLNKTIADPSVLEWKWINAKFSLPDTREHILGIRIREKDACIDKLYIDASSSIPINEGPEYTVSPYLTVHMQVYGSSGNSPTTALYIYDYKNSITEITKSDWYNFNINTLDVYHGYTKKEHFTGSYFLVMSCSGTEFENFVVWELVDNDEYTSSPSAIKF